MDEIKNLCSVRAFIEGEAAAQAATNATGEDKKEIENANRDLMDGMAKRDIDLTVHKNHEFHFAIYNAAHNEVLHNIIQTLWLQSGPYLALLYSGDEWIGDRIEATTIEWHGRALAAIKSGEPENARQAITRDIEAAADVYADAILRTGDKAGDKAGDKKSDKEKEDNGAAG